MLKTYPSKWPSANGGQGVEAASLMHMSHEGFKPWGLEFFGGWNHTQLDGDYTPGPQFAPENRGPLEKEIPALETTIFRCELLVSGRVY